MNLFISVSKHSVKNDESNDGRSRSCSSDAICLRSTGIQRQCREDPLWCESGSCRIGNELPGGQLRMWHVLFDA